MHALQQLLVLGAGASAVAAGGDHGKPSVTLASGVVVGTTTTLAGATAAVDKYVGIPFAQSPPKRFLPPKEAPSWTEPLHAVETKPACVQQFNAPKSVAREAKRIFNNPGGPPPPESEDCLYLNVYVPPNTNSSSGKPVMFWIFGGDLQFGWGGLLNYDGTSFASNQDVILVTHNYRTNVFGFPNAPELSDKHQNAGYHDQRFALRWVRQNIAQFGGDPDKVTIFGESAGGESVKQLIAAPPSPLTFRAAIMESQSATFVGNATESWKTLVDLMGCKGKNKVLKCMRQQPAKALKKAIQSNMLDFAPQNNGLTNNDDVRGPIKDGTTAKVPILLGTNADEGRPFAYLLGLDHPGGKIEPFLEGMFPDQPELRKTLKKRFKSSGQSVYHFASDVITNATFTCTTSLLADVAQKHGYDVWRYYYDAAFKNLNLFPDAGVFHSAEIPEVFGTYPREGATKQQKKLSKFMQGAWASFAKDPSEGPGWHKLGSKGKIAEIGADGSTGETIVSASYVDEACPIYADLVDATGP